MEWATCPATRSGDRRLLEIYFIDVGQGDSMFIQTADDKRVSGDGGKDARACSLVKRKYDLEKYFKDFDAVIMTCGDNDHVAGRVYKIRQKKERARYAKSLWDWEKYAFSLKNAKQLSNDLSEDE